MDLFEYKKILKEILETVNTYHKSSRMQERIGKSSYRPESYQEKKIVSLCKKLVDNIWDLSYIAKKDEISFFDIKKQLEQIKDLSLKKDYPRLIDEIWSVEKKLMEAEREFGLVTDEIKNLEIGFEVPNEIIESVLMDFDEIKKCYGAGAYRSCVILCGRILEIFLHRKYFEKTGDDLLESSPNLGLGKLLKKLNEAGILYPGLNEQIDLVNNVRTYSVHKKKKEFEFSKDQAKAIILFTFDSLRKLCE